MCSVLFSVYKAPLCKGSWLPQGRLRQGIDRLHSLVSGLPAWRGRSPLGVPFCCQKGTKDHQRRGLPPPCGIHPAVLGGTCTFLFSALGPARSHRWHGYSTECSCFSGRQHFYCQGLTLVCNCSQLPEAGRKKPLNIAEFLALLGVGEGLAPPESPRAIQGNQRAGQATALTAAQQDGAAKPPAAGTPLGQGRPGRGNRPSIGPVAQGSLVS